MTQVSQKLWKAWVLAFVCMMGECRELKPFSAAVQTALQIQLVIEFLFGVICERYDYTLHATL